MNSIEKYYKYIYYNFDIIQGINPSQFKQECQADILTILKNRSEGARVVIFKMKKWSTKKFRLRKLQIAFVQLLEFIISQEIETQKNGLVVVIDLQGFKLEHLRALSVKELHRMLTAILVSSIYQPVISCKLQYDPMRPEKSKFLNFKLNSEYPRQITESKVPDVIYAPRILMLITLALSFYLNI